MADPYEDKTVLVTGGTGSIGSALVAEVLRHGPAAVRVLTNDENSLHAFKMRLQRPDVRFLLGDVRSKDRMRRAMQDVDIVFHAAALKHVPFCEYNPFEAVEVNVLGTQNVVDTALDAGVEAIIGISTDKAVNPANTMGATKLLSERLLLDANHFKGAAPTRFWCARFGNVLNSRGSILPVVRQRVAEGGPVLITDADMTRFVLPIERAAHVVADSVRHCRGGEVVVPAEMDVVRVGDLVEVAVEHFARRAGKDPAAIARRVVGMRPGEKMHEALFTEEEAARVRRVGEAYMLCGLPVPEEGGPRPGCLAAEVGEPVPGLALRSDQATPLARPAIARLLETVLEEDEAPPLAPWP